MEIPLTGNIKDVSLVKLLVYLNRNRKTKLPFPCSFQDTGIKKRAHSNFGKALKIDPANEKARQGFEQTKW